MEIGKSEEPWYTPMVLAFIGQDVPRLLGLLPEMFARDVLTLERRVAKEGESFLTKTLPAFASQVDLALRGDRPLETSCFRKQKGSALPRFLYGLTRRVFTDDGYIAVSPCTDSIRLLRQTLLWCKKVEKGYSEESLRRAVDDFIAIDRALPDQPNFADTDILGFSRALILRVYKDINLAEMSPKHGPGSVANCTLRDKRDLSTSYKDLEKVFRPIPWFRSLRDAVEQLADVLDRPCKQYGLSEFAFVNKDSSGPRIIGLEPAEYMWCQQALKQRVYDHLEHSKWTRGQVNFTNQEINRNLTSDLWYDTLDMSKASDRNSFVLVKALYEKTSIWPYMEASRTPGTVMPDGSVLIYKKFAPMGSAMCFPTMALTFYAIAVATLHLRCKMALRLALKNVFVYGDDLVVPTGHFRELQEVFNNFHIQFNSNKCCTTGRFRESCGLDAFAGVNVTPVRLRKPHIEDALGLKSVVEHHNNLMSARYHCAASALRDAFYEHGFLKLACFNAVTVPASNLPNLSILHWEGYPDEQVTPRCKGGRWFVQGWTLVPRKRRGKVASEKRYYREVLSRGGVVGELPKPRVRLFAERYTAVLKRKKIPWGPTVPSREVCDEMNVMPWRDLVCKYVLGVPVS